MSLLTVVNELPPGSLRNLLNGQDATLGGGSTSGDDLHKFWDDFQIIGLPAGDKQRGVVLSQARTNLLAGLPAGIQNTSFEVDATDGDYTLTAVTGDVVAGGFHGDYCWEGTASSADPGRIYVDAAAVLGNAQYTLTALIRANNAGAVGSVFRPGLQGDVSGVTWGSPVTLTTEWQQVTVTKTFAGDTNRIVYPFYQTGNAEVGDKIGCDCVQVVSGAVPPPFVESEALATSCTFPTPITAGNDATGIIFLWIPQAMSSTNRVHLDLLDANSGIQVEFSGSRLVFSCQNGTAGKAKYYTSAIAAGFHVIAWARHYTGTDIELRLAVDGVLATADGTPSGSGDDQFNQPFGVATDGTYIWVADRYNHRIVKRLASDLSYVSKVGSQGSGDDQFNQPFGVATDGTYIWVADTYNYRIVKRDAGTLAYVDESPVAVSFETSLPATLSLPNSGNCVQLQFMQDGYAASGEELQAMSSLRTWMSPARDGYMRNRGGLVIPTNNHQGVDCLLVK
jgi:hypothetical protein